MTRRTLLGFFPASILAADAQRAVGARFAQVTDAKRTRQPTPSRPRGEFFRFADSVTENPVVRLTLPAHQSYLPEHENRFVSSREAFLVFSSDRLGHFAPFRANLKSGIIDQIAETTSLSPRSMALDWKERHLLFIDGETLRITELPRGKSKTLVEAVSAFHLGGPHDTIVVRQGNKLLRLSETGLSEIADNVSSRGIVNPRGEGCVFTRQEIEGENEFWFASFGSPQPRLLAKGKISFPYWRPDGHALLFLRDVDRHTYTASVLCEVALDGFPERAVSDTTQFSSFAPNGDGSVFVGASRSHAQPNIILLLRSSRREMVLCEHRASSPQGVCPAFSPNSQRVYFQSDHEGKSSLYSVNVERLVAETEEF